MKNRFLSIKLLTISLVLFACAGNAFAAGAKDRTVLYNDLIKYGTADQIRKQLVEDEKFAKSVDGVASDNILMQAIAVNRETEIIKMLLDANIDPMAKNAENQNAVMYSCAYLSDPEAITKVIKKGTLTKSAVRKRLLKNDRSDLNAVDYAYKLNNKVAIETIMPYLSEELIASYADKYSGTAIAQAPKVEKKEAVVAEKQKEEPTKQPEPQKPAEKIVEPTKEKEIKEEPPKIAKTETPAIVKQESTYLFDNIEPPEKPAVVPAVDTTLIYIPDASQVDAQGRTRLMKAVVDGDMPMVSNLLFSGAAVDDTDKDGWTALMYAARYQNDSRITQSLIAAGADTHKKNRYGLSALTLAATYSQSEDVISLLLNAHRSIDEDVIQSFVYSLTTPSGKSVPLQTRVTELFLNKGIDVNLYWKGKTPLMYAAQSTQSTEIISMLLARGARTDVASNDGHNAFYYAEQNTNLPRNDVFWSLNSKR